MSPRARLTLAPLALALLLAGCTGGDPPAAAPTTTAPPPRASAPPAPMTGTCHQLGYAQAVAPTTQDAPPVPCSGAHTSQTYAVGGLEAVVGGHLLAVDSDRVQQRVATVCPQRLGRFVGGTAEQRRLSMLRAVWFTPTVAAADAGADWFRCDVIAVAGHQRLATLKGSLRGVLDKESGRAWAMCGTAKPGTAGFARVPCAQRHSWRTLRTVDLRAGAYPGAAEAKSAGQAPCRAAGREAAEDALNYQWGYEWPTAAQWRAGQTYGICWAPS